MNQVQCIWCSEKGDLKGVIALVSWQRAKTMVFLSGVFDKYLKIVARLTAKVMSGLVIGLLGSNWGFYAQGKWL